MEIFVKFACFVMVAVGCGNVHSFLLLDITYFIFNWKKKKTKIKSYSPYIVTRLTHLFYLSQLTSQTMRPELNFTPLNQFIFFVPHMHKKWLRFDMPVWNQSEFKSIIQNIIKIDTLQAYHFKNLDYNHHFFLNQPIKSS